jgi:hypothetical protein
VASESDYRHSVLREIIGEHLFIGEILRNLWNAGITDAEVLHSEFDAGGYDLVLSRGVLVRHIQLKTKRVGGSSRDAKLSLSLAARPSGCVICLVFGGDLTIDHFLWFGNANGEPLPDIAGYKVAKHTKGNSSGEKGERPNLRVVPFSKVERVMSWDVLIERLLGARI